MLTFLSLFVIFCLLIQICLHLAAIRRYLRILVDGEAGKTPPAARPSTSGRLISLGIR